MRQTILITGAFISVLLGYAVFQITGLSDAVESPVLKYALGFLIMAIYLIIYRSAATAKTETTDQLETEEFKSEEIRVERTPVPEGNEEIVGGPVYTFHSHDHHPLNEHT